MITNQEKNMALGIGVTISGFNDGVLRKCYPFTLENLDDLNISLAIINCDDLNENFNDEYTYFTFLSLLKFSFRDLNEEEFEKLLDAIDEKNFNEIINDIKKINGVVDSKGEIDLNKSKNTVDWTVAVSAIIAYTCIPFNQIKDLTLPAFNGVMEMIGKKINWEYKEATIGLVKEPSKHLSEDEHPLHCEPKKEGKRITTMRDIMGFVNG